MDTELEKQMLNRETHRTGLISLISNVEKYTELRFLLGRNSVMIGNKKVKDAFIRKNLDLLSLSDCILVDKMLNELNQDILDAHRSAGMRDGIKQALAKGGGKTAPILDHMLLKGSDNVEILYGKTGSLLDDLEREAIKRVLDDCSGNRSEAVKTLGLSIRTLRNKLNKYKSEM